MNSWDEGGDGESRGRTGSHEPGHCGQLPGLRPAALPRHHRPFPGPGASCSWRRQLSRTGLTRNGHGPSAWAACGVHPVDCAHEDILSPSNASRAGTAAGRLLARISPPPPTERLHMSTATTTEPRIQLRMHPLVPRLLRVADIQTPGTVHAPDCARPAKTWRQPFPFEPLAASDHVKLVFPEIGVGRNPPAHGGGRQAGHAGRPAAAPLPRLHGACLRRRGPAPDHGLCAPRPRGCRTLGTARGDRRPAGRAGPRGSHIYPGDFEHYLIAGDETALPAMARWVEELPARRHGGGVHQRSHQWRKRSPWRSGPASTSRYLDRSAHGPAVLLDGGAERCARPPGELFVWAAGEAAAIKPIRRHVREVLEHPAGARGH